MAIHLSLRVAPLDLQQSGNSRNLYVHVPTTWMSILVYLMTDINSSLFLLTKHPLFLRSSGTGTEISVFSTRPMWGTFWVCDARLTLFSSSSISICVEPIDIPIIKFSVNWWNTLHQHGSIIRSVTSIRVSMLIPILSNFANFPFFTLFFFILETRLLILSFLESSLIEEIKARECMYK
ncbi:hypothetical protein MKX01_036244 [Papaver californicum]|nr:hypothetical protein MKX01_036244 [Papaver californicum]